MQINTYENNILEHTWTLRYEARTINGKLVDCFSVYMTPHWCRILLKLFDYGVVIIMRRYQKVNGKLI